MSGIDSISLIDGKFETLFNERDFECLLESYMGYDAVRYFRDRIQAREDQIDELLASKNEIHDWVKTSLLTGINVIDEDEREKWGEEFQAKVEDVYGIES